MKYYAPSYYSAFSCIGGKCTHSCCAGWEIDIDDETLVRYHEMGGETGRLLREHIDESGEVACFRMTKDERCPFLNRDGLCDLIIAEGDDILCQICADHPRFRSFFADREEIGLGMCCEAACRLILTWEDPVQLELIDDDGFDDEESETEQALIDLRKELIAVMQDRTQPVLERVGRIAAGSGLPANAPDYLKWAEYLLTLERMENGWADRLNELKSNADCGESALSAPEWELALEQLMVYLLFRHLPAAAADGDASGRIAYAALMWMMLRKLCAVHAAVHETVEIEDFVQLCRMYSSEIEYSDVNVDAILDKIRFGTQP